MELHKYIIAIVLFGVIVVSGALIITDINTNYGFIGVDLENETFGGVYNTINETYLIATGQQERLLGDLDKTNTESSMFAGAVSAMRLIPNSFRIVGDILKEIFIQIGIPDYFLTATNAVILISVFFSFIYMFFRYQPR